LQHLAYETQLRWKRQWLADALQRIGGLTAQVLPSLGAEQSTCYRDRVQLHTQWQDGSFKLGFYGRASRELVESSSCLMMRPLLAQLTRLLSEALPIRAERLDGLRHIALRCDSQGGQAMLALVGVEEQDGLDELAALLMEREPRLVSLWANWGRAVYGIYGESWRQLAGLEKLPDNLGNLRLQISPGAFTQINAAQARRLYGRVAHYAALSGAETLLDAYSGVGMIALYLAAKARKVIGVEEYAPALADARRNAELNGITNCRFVAGRVEDALPRLAAEGLRIDAAVLDPPRAGCAAPALKALAELKPQRIIYVSCDPATLARDARLLTELGYLLHEAQPVDMFPHTGHVEAVAQFCMQK
jgi:23S rRNA (uracil1939-C5)-methyltransferase